MREREREREVLLEEAVYLFSLVLIAFYYVYLRWSLTGELRESSLEAMTGYTAWKPFQFRVLVPFLVHVYRESGLPGALAPLPDIYRAVEFAAFLSLLIVFRRYAYLITRDRFLSYVSALLLFIAMVFNYVLPFGNMSLSAPETLPSLSFEGRYALFNPYDTPSLLFFTLGLVFLYRKQMLPYYILFAVATFNRETSCFLTFVYLLTSWRNEKTGTVLVHCAAQFAVWAGIKAALSALFAGNEGGLIEWPLTHNLGLLIDPAKWPHLLSAMGYLWLPTLLFTRRIRDEFVRRSLLVLIPYALGMLFVGIYDELRIWGELIPVVVPAFVLVVMGSRRARDQ